MGLEMMVKQSLCTQDGADAVFKRAQEGDALLDAAIEQYANDRDVGEFLETLQLLAALSPDDIDELIRSAAEKGDVDSDGANDDTYADKDDDKEDDPAASEVSAAQ